MKVLFSRSIVMLCVFQLSFFFVPVYAQNQNRGDSDNHKVFYGIHLGFTENKVDLYYTQGGEAQALEQGDHSFYAPGFRIAVIGGVRLGKYFSLRAMPGVSIFGKSWKPSSNAEISTPSINYKVESVLGELPIDVKFHPFRIVNLKPQLVPSYLVPYLTSGLSYQGKRIKFPIRRIDNRCSSLL